MDQNILELLRVREAGRSAAPAPFLHCLQQFPGPPRLHNTLQPWVISHSLEIDAFSVPGIPPGLDVERALVGVDAAAPGNELYWQELIVVSLQPRAKKTQPRSVWGHLWRLVGAQGLIGESLP